MNKKEICKILDELCILLQLKGEGFFKTKAYSEASRIVEFLEEDVETLVKEDRLKDIKGIGKALNQKISELVLTGKLQYYENLKKEIPDGLIDMLNIPNLGAKKIKTIYDELNISTIEELEKAAQNNELVNISGFAKKTQDKILENIKFLNFYKGKMLFSKAEIFANQIVNDLKKNKDIIRIEICGSLRRKKEIVKDIDILVSANYYDIGKLFLEHHLVEKVTSNGKTKCSVILKDGINADLRIVKDEEFPYALHHFTGSKEHNIKMRHISKEIGITMNEYGLFKKDELIKCKNEKEIFEYFNMDFIEPELRENNGEVESSKSHKLPNLLEVEDIKGIVHVHSNYSDGENRIEELVKYCIDFGYEYMVLSDHSQSAFYANGLKPDDIKRQHDEVNKINSEFNNFKILKSIELDILIDGSLDYNKEILSLFDLRIASVHSSFNMDEDKITNRVVKAMENEFVNILGHPTGRLLLAREPLKLNMDKIIETAKEQNVILEINSYPERLDLDWKYIKKAKDLGCKFVISSDAHSLSGINNIRYGVNIARKGWLEKDNVLNTFNYDKFIKSI